MADTVAEHLQVKKGESIAIVGATAEQRALLLPLPEGSTEASVADADAVFAFSPDLDQLHRDLADLLPQLVNTRVVWLGYLKGGKGPLNRDIIARAVLEHGWRAIGNRPLNDEWSAVRVRPLKNDEDPLALRP
ncbi:hypothetical protein [Gryllotalpicola protaetiae]|uniref:DUF3052 family protein n=1 Tax=Gryllotalpicola protaetiae TaxID=2419771 RepID=A0A387BV06_9MICO|nr:hypothetical protein [Gryllotalpicola protaetiae]AYG04940.1 hypothetical protein D7I44_16370 [Gryllotalpicola protaetiae]